tara:strand:+ start:466 stop:1092 length:627 start_codon:yes stop_codon:yes gene_type:complete
MKYDLFNSYIWKSKVKYDNKENLIKTLSEDFYKNKNKLTSRWDCFVYSSFRDLEQNNIAEDLLDIIWEKVSEYLNNCPKELQIKGTYILSEIWYNVYEKNYFQNIHDHGNSLFSGCYYLKFNKDIHHQTTFYNPNYNLDYEKLEDNPLFSFEPDCEEDDLIIFPSNLKHGTKGIKEKTSDDLRITISFNIINPDICLNTKKQNKGVYS